jgi:Flp pilus assembly protein TadG
MTKLRWFSAFRNSRRRGRLKTADRRFLSNESGTTAIEFAMIAVPFIGLIGAVFETGNVYFRTSQLQSATEIAGRNVLTHSVAAGLTYQDFVNRYVCTWQTTGAVTPGTLGKMFDCSKLLVSITAPTSWGATYNNSFYTTASLASAITLPAPQSVVVIRIAYPVSSVAAILTGGAFKGQTITQSHAGQIQWSGNNNAWSYMIMGIYAFKVEP